MSDDVKGLLDQWGLSFLIETFEGKFTSSYVILISH
jgi:hypothetical protein